MALVPGDRLGPYKIESLLGTGGMGEVYRGLDTRLGRAVALKVISRALVGDEASRRRFETEARAASALNHPSIVTIYDIGESDGTSWIAMELIEGHTLSEEVARGPLSIRQAWSIARQLADGLAVAHAKGIVHRDLKPANVMLTEDSRVKILDFGLARQNAAFIPEGTDTVTAGDAGTVAGSILGTVGYMSPEQATSRPADFRADQFSFGAVVYELLTGRRAFARPTAVETLSAILRDDPQPVSLFRRDVSEGFQRALNRCLEKEPARRFESTRELATALDVLTPESASGVGSVVTTIDQPGPSPRTTPLTRRGWMTIAAVTALAAIAALAWNRWDAAAPAAITSVAVLPFETSADDSDIEYIGEGVTDGLIDHLSRAASLKVMARATVSRFKGERNPQEAARALGVGAVVTGSLSRRGDQIAISAELIHGVTGERLWGQTYDRPTTDLMRIQDSIVLSIAEGLRLRLTGEEKARLGGFGTVNPEAYELLLKGRYMLQFDTEAGDLEARKLFTQATEKDPDFLDAYLALASTYARAIGSGYEPPEQVKVLADTALARASAIDPKNVAVRVAMMERRFVQTRDWQAAERAYRQVMHEPAIFQNVQWHPISLFFVALGRPDEAVALAERALTVDPGNLESRAMLGNFLLQAGRLDDAFRVYNGIATDAPDDPRSLLGIAEVHKRRGEYAAAGEARRKAHQLVGEEEAARAFARTANEAEYAKAEVAASRARLRELEERAKQAYVSPLDIARLHALIGNREQALAGLERGVDHPDPGLTLLKVDQAWDSVRADPRFLAVVRRVGIP
jgi:TolB-like protein/cytochrome c-type biogenesis protein CcmH/NrfG/predicted Ser/Thr protein kinase